MDEILLKRRKSLKQPTNQFIPISLEYCNRRILTPSSRLHIVTLFEGNSTTFDDLATRV